jgi:hypothetical protein
LASSDGPGRNQPGSLVVVRDEVVALRRSHEPSQRSLRDCEVLGTAHEVDAWLSAHTMFAPRRHKGQVGFGFGSAPPGDSRNVACGEARI